MAKFIIVLFQLIILTLYSVEIAFLKLPISFIEKIVFLLCLGGSTSKVLLNFLMAFKKLD